MDVFRIRHGFYTIVKRDQCFPRSHRFVPGDFKVGGLGTALVTRRTVFSHDSLLKEEKNEENEEKEEKDER